MGDRLLESMKNSTGTSLAVLGILVHIEESVKGAFLKKEGPYSDRVWQYLPLPEKRGEWPGDEGLVHRSVALPGTWCVVGWPLSTNLGSA